MIGDQDAFRALFNGLDELAEFAPHVLDVLREPLEEGRVTLARGIGRRSYPADFQLVAAMNPCKCGYMAEADRACARVPTCGEDYLGRISGPLMDRFDLRVDVPPVSYADLDLPSGGENSETVSIRVAKAHDRQAVRFRSDQKTRSNSDMSGDLLEHCAAPDPEGRDVLLRAAERFRLSARGYHRVMRVARTIADLDHSDRVRRPHVAEAISFRIPG